MLTVYDEEIYRSSAMKLTISLTSFIVTFSATAIGYVLIPANPVLAQVLRLNDLQRQIHKRPIAYE
jgi:hypothetical protein